MKDLGNDKFGVIEVGIANQVISKFKNKTKEAMNSRRSFLKKQLVHDRI